MILAHFLFGFVGTVAINLVTWAFAVKYWIVARKVQLLQTDQSISNHEKMFAWILKGGMSVIVLLEFLSMIPTFIVVANTSNK